MRHCVWWGFAYCSWPRTWTRALAQHKLSISADFLHAKLNLYVISCLKFSVYNSLWPRSYSSVLSGQWGHFTRYQVPRFGTLEYRYSVLGTRYRPSLVPNDTKHLTNEPHGNFLPLASFTEPTPPSYTGKPRDLASCKDRKLWEAPVSSKSFNLISLIKPNTLIIPSFPSSSSMTCGSCEDSSAGLSVEHSFLSFPMDWCHRLLAVAAAAAQCWCGWLEHD